MAFADKESLRVMMEEFEEFIEEGNLLVERSKTIDGQIKATIKLVSVIIDSSGKPRVLLNFK